MTNKPPKQATVTLEYMPYIDQPPIPPHALHHQACANDGVTIDSWRDTWIKNIKYCKEHFGGDLVANGIGQLWNKHQLTPMIVAGSGPSLRKNAHLFKDRGEKIGLISCLHNFHYLEEMGANVDYYVSLDAGEVVLEELSEGGEKKEEEYWEMTKDRTLLAFIGSPPDLFKMWKGPIYLFNCPVPDPVFEQSCADLNFHSYVGTGGNVAGACMYISKGFLGAGTIIFTGMDLSFGYDYKFHPWKSKYDKELGNVLRMSDVYGNMVKTWQSYSNFKAWFDKICCTVPGPWFNCTEGGTLGAYPQGIMRHIITMDLEDCLRAMHMNSFIADQAANPATAQKLLLF